YGSGDAAEVNVETPTNPTVEKTQLLQGKWISTKDTNVSWTFSGDQLTESLQGTPVRSQSGTYSLNDDCLNGDGSGAKAAASYLNLLNPDRCFFIVSLTEKELSLSYVGRGNTLRFTKQ
ncbi:MAG: hypothetical protein AAF597_17230, partial [Bacteroidota bacterium]